MTFYRFDKGIISPGTAASEKSYLATPRGHRSDGTKRAVIFCGGHNGDALTGLSTLVAFPDQALAAVIGIGLPLLCIDAGGQLFGNDTAQTRLNEAITWVGSSGFGKSDAVILLGVSMGSILASNYAARNAAKVQALGLLYPAVDMSYLDASAGTDLANAYGGTAGVTTAINANPSYSALKLAQQTRLNGITTKGWVSSNDMTAGGYATWTPFADAIVAAGGTRPADYNLGPVGHGDETQLPQADIASWLAAHA